MADYDFAETLSPLDFELLSKDILEAELGLRLENFREGKDKGIDLRYAPLKGSKNILVTSGLIGAQEKTGQLIVQCKRYSSFSSLKSVLKNEEIPKIVKLAPSRYILTTSVSLSPQQVDELVLLLSPYVLSSGDIFGRERLNGILTKHQEIERRHIKLWVSSSGVLDAILNAGTHVISREEVERTIAAAKLYVRNHSFDEALNILKEHRVCIISGLPGIGKTTLARMLLLYFFERQFDVVKIVGDVSEARAVGYHNNPRFYYYDDFLGQTAQADKLNKNEDQKLIDFMASVRDSKDSVLVLTTREYILNQARLYYEKIDREKFDHRTCVIDLSKYSRRIRAEILYNHLHFSNLPRDYVASLVASRGYIKIVDHPNYNPRLIESLTSAAWAGGASASDYLQLFIGHLDNPAAIWEHAFRNQISDSSRHLLFVLTTLPTEVRLEDLDVAFSLFHVAQCKQYNIAHTATDFKRSLKELDGTFVSTRKVFDRILVRFQNPSIRDFLQNLLFGGECLVEVIGSLAFFEQAQWLFASLKEQGAAALALSKQHRAIIDSMEKLFEVDSCSIANANFAQYEPPRMQQRNPALRLVLIAGALGDAEEPRDVVFIINQLVAFTNNLKDGLVSPAACLPAVKGLAAFGYLDTAQGVEFLNVFKVRSSKNLSDLGGFETLASFVEVLPNMFSLPELEDAKKQYSIFADKLSVACVNGESDLDDPDVIREEVSRIEYIADVLGADTQAAQSSMHSFADEMERQSEAEREWEPDDDDYRGGGSSGFSECSDGDIDSMFGTLGD